MSVDGRLYREGETPAGGVCLGIADYFGVDVIIVRIVAIILAVVTLGFAILIYAILWKVLPRTLHHAQPYDVVPEEARSDAYGALDPVRMAHTNNSRAAAVAAARAAAHGPYKQVGHEPPSPPCRSGR